MPSTGPQPLPILAALPTRDDSSFYEVKSVPHGVIETPTYQDVAGNDKRLHVYLPPGYAESKATYPVLYLNHGGGDDDSRWSATDKNGGHASVILDNLLALKLAKPMIVVMPSTRGLASFKSPKPGEPDACSKEYMQCIVPFVEKNYRARADRDSRAIAGLSMGGFVVLNTGIPNLDTFSELYVYSSGYIEDEHRAAMKENFASLLNDAEANKRFNVPLYFAAGETDIALNNSFKTMAIFNSSGVRTFSVLSDGGHDWSNWRRYLWQTAQVMFPASKELAQSPATSSTTLKDTFQSQFALGVAVNRSMTGGRAFRRSEEEVQADIALAKKHFNHVVAENDMKWQLIHPRPGSEGYDFAPADGLISFAQSNNMVVAGHTLVWHSQTPNWVFEGSHAPPADSERTRPESSVQPGSRTGGPGGFRGFDLNGPRASREELLERMRDHIHTVVGRYKGKVKVWDVVNEAISDSGTDILRRSPWSVIIGPDFIAKAFEYAHEADPAAILRYNDYGLEKPEKRSKLIKLIKSLQEQKVPVGAIGSQAHCNVSTTFEQMDEALSEMETLGLPIHITELDVNSAAAGQRGTGADINANSNTTQVALVENAEQRLADAYAGLFRAFVKHQDSIEVVTFWGINDAVSWRSQGRPLLFDGENLPKPAFDAVIQSSTAK